MTVVNLRKSAWLLGVFCFVIAAYNLSAFAQQDPLETIRVTSRLVSIDVLVADKRTGLRIDGLKREAFAVTDNGRPVEITQFSQDTDPPQPLALMLLINTRTTTKANVPRLRAALGNALKNLRPQDEIAVMDYWYGHEMVQYLTRDRERILEALSAVAARQEQQRARPPSYGYHNSGVGEDLAAALAEALRHAQERQPRARIAIVVIDDDLNATAKRVVTDTTEQLLANSATVSGLIKVSGWFAKTLKPIGHAINASHYPTFNQRPGENVAHYSAETGGEIINVREGDYATALEQVIGNLASRYSLGFIPDVTRLDGRFHKLSVKVKFPATRGDDRKPLIRARKGYFARNEK